MIFEAIIALLLLSAMIAGVARLTVSAGRHRQAAGQRLVAQLAAANLLEQAYALPWDQLTDATLAEFQLSPQAEQTLPGGAARLEVEDLADAADAASGLQARRLTVVVSWQTRGGIEAQASLSAWRYRSAEAAP